MNKAFIKYYLWVLLSFLLSCSKELSRESEQLPIEKLYIVESDFPQKETSKFFMDLFGYCELDKNFNLKAAVKLDDGNFYTSKTVISDSLRQMVSRTIKNYWVDTVYIFLRESRIFDMENRNDHTYFLIMEKEDGEKATIRFGQNTLPKDLNLVYKFLYYDLRETIGNDILLNNIDSLHRVFDKEIMYNMYMISSPIEFIVPDIKYK